MRLATVLLLLGLATPCALASDSATAECGDRAWEAISSIGKAQKSWAAIHEHFRRFATCDDGDVAEGYSEGVLDLLANAWQELPSLAKLARQDTSFRAFVMHHIDDMEGYVPLALIVANAQRTCPAGEEELCRQLGSAASKVLERMEGGDPRPGPLDPEISRVETGGYWERKRIHGYHRVVVQTRCSAEHCRDRLFVQWVIEGRPHQVVATRYVREVGDLTNVTRVHIVSLPGGTKVEVDHQRGDGDRWTKCLSLGPEGGYEVLERACGGGP